MNITNIKYFSTVNGTGVRTAVFVAGCNLHCDGCFNNGAWSFEAGKGLSLELINKILDSIEPEYISGLSILGGEPLDPKNQSGVTKLIEKFRARFGNTKTIWLWTGYEYENVPLTEHIFYILEHVDVIVDGPFIARKKDLKLPYRGSSNQRIIDAKQSTFCNIVELDVE
jgi:anaerobic ribonucleoside-triphosphate reductase activating protein